MKQKLRLLLAIIIIPLPWPLKRRMLSLLSNSAIHPTARIGFSLILSDTIIMSPHARIGHFNIVRDLRLLQMGPGSAIKQFNWITSAPDFWRNGPHPAGGFLLLQDSAVIGSRNYIDCSGGFSLGKFSLMAGVRGTVFSHQIDYRLGVQTAQEVTVGDYCAIGSNVCFVPGSSLAPRSQVAMGSVVVGENQPPGYLWAGVPAKRKREVDGAWFHRQHESVGVQYTQN
jgi:acetyltransferase-like isoleucine patch superfamily enzyme